MCQVSIFFLGAVSEIQVKSFPVFPIWLPHHVTHDVIIINKTFCMNSRSNGENFVSIGQAVAKNNTKVQCSQTNKHRKTNKGKITHRATLGKTAQSRMALGGAHTSARWKRLRFVSH